MLVMKTMAMMIISVMTIMVLMTFDNDVGDIGEYMIVNKSIFLSTRKLNVNKQIAESIFLRDVVICVKIKHNNSNNNHNNNSNHIVS